MPEFKPTVCLDFDGVIHSYERGWQGGVIYGTAVPGFFRWATEAVKKLTLVVYSSRSKTPEGQAAMREAIGAWSKQAVLDGEVSGDYDWSHLFGAMQLAHEKPAAWLTIDDRAMQFLGNWSAAGFQPDRLLDFKPWNAGGTVRPGRSMGCNNKADEIAVLCHEVNRAICEAAGDHSQVPWDQAARWQQDSAIKGVEFAIANPDAPASAQHDAWMADKTADGWVYGPTKDAAAKTHPCMVPYDVLPFEQRVKDHAFKAIVAALA